ncbi:putative sulfate exporter family transporter [Zhouia spongiae]|uniref:Sulfate exporter family transporter n=1 Tax=Zhouia spongiae TaxID=2202721 RepID=A0ABY3YK86_9FLAO|nr:putative sulfate exporter family transporter [Zhouia spongiae]UNY97911.1 putative sulfate exporter family transporter [Zhouia spongiae]
MKVTITRLLFIAIILLALSGLISSVLALILGFLFTLFFNNPYETYSHKAIQFFLKLSVVGLGFGMFLKETIQTGLEGLELTFLSIILTVTLGLLLTKGFKLDRQLGHLITSGTSICGGSAIAAISPVIKAKGKTISIALAVIFLLNSVALFIFPVIGRFFHLNQHDFGLWCAIAIHDTSSVVGAAMNYGDEALKIATTVKLSRTLWIVPLSVFSMFMFKTKGEKIKIPYFILLFITAIVINSFHILPIPVTGYIVLISKRLLVVTLFIIGTTISLKEIKTTGMKPILLALSLWLFISLFSLLYIM